MANKTDEGSICMCVCVCDAKYPVYIIFSTNHTLVIVMISFTYRGHRNDGLNYNLVNNKTNSYYKINY